MRFVTPLEVSVLQALADGRWYTSVEIADRADQAPYAVRSALAELRRRRLVQSGKGHGGGEYGTWSLTPTGHVEAAKRAQLRLV